MASSAFIGSSFILKKKGLKRAADSGTRAGELDCDYVIQLWYQLFYVSMMLDFIIRIFNLPSRSSFTGELEENENVVAPFIIISKMGKDEEEEERGRKWKLEST